MFWSSSLSKVLYVIEKRTEEVINEKNFNIALCKALGGRIGFIKTQGKEQDVYVDSFDDLL